MHGGSAETEVIVRCGGAEHVIRWSRHRLDLLGHPGRREEDDVLVALSGSPARCRVIEEAWRRLDRARAAELLAASPERLELLASRLAATLDQRGYVSRRDDLTDAERAEALAAFDQMAYLAEIAALGPVLARRCAQGVLRRRWWPPRRRHRTSNGEMRSAKGGSRLRVPRRGCSSPMPPGGAPR
ncbi:MAG TPA: hypothetical protein VM143_07080 [Acidimicrobiales bacterium]|nr:hypothetical protein [Acidimicrobiales bacterium]